MEQLASMGVFVQVVEANSFSAAADRLGLSKSAVSKHISRLEDQLGAQLLNRTTRRLHLTEVGAAFYERCVRIMAQVQEAERQVLGMNAVPRGTLRVSVPVSFGRLHLAPAMAEFLACYPEIQVEMVVNDRMVDLIEEGFDVAIRVAVLPDSTSIARRLAPSRRVACATPAYFKQYGLPQTPDDLRQYNCFTFAHAASQSRWRFQGPRGEYTVPVSGNFQANHGEVVREAALSSLGVALSPTFIVGQDLSRGTLQAVFADITVSKSSVYAIYPHNRHLSPKVRVFIDFFAERFGPRPYWDKWDGSRRKRRKAV